MTITKETYNDCLNELTKAFSEKLKGTSFINTHSGELGEVIEVSRISKTIEGLNILVSMDFNGEIKRFSFPKAFESMFNDKDQINLFNNIYSDFESDISACFNVQSEINREKAEELQKVKAEEKAKKQAKLEAEKQAVRDAKTKIMLNNKFAEIKNSGKHSASSFYKALGYFAKNISSISANVPDFLDSWFSQKFGEETSRSIIDTSVKTSGGYKMKFGLAFSVSVKKMAPFANCFTQKFTNKKKVTDTDLVFDLVENYGFCFGQEQDVDKIITMVPEMYLGDFNEGFNE